MENSEHHAHPRTPPDTDQRRLVTHLHGSGPVTPLASRVMVPHADMAQEPLKAEYTFIPKTVSSNDTFIQNQFHPKIARARRVGARRVGARMVGARSVGWGPGGGRGPAEGGPICIEILGKPFLDDCFQMKPFSD